MPDPSVDIQTALRNIPQGFLSAADFALVSEAAGIIDHMQAMTASLSQSFEQARVEIQTLKKEHQFFFLQSMSWQAEVLSLRETLRVKSVT